MNNEMTVAEVIGDPMIRVLNDADKISERAFAQLMESAARVTQSRKRPFGGSMGAEAAAFGAVAGE